MISYLLIPVADHHMTTFNPLQKSALPTPVDFTQFKCNKFLFGSEEHNPMSSEGVGENTKCPEV